ncbi:dihydrofolate reductase [Aureimonas endophytica]|uniref:Dihydrofolate reductase n=1 Tax=Aureimonas endophytica TaxID=2027858 RepID=A0A916ZF66_9HYPH|nr:dihydrofolate reductase [Aureimonas endophytica]GGD92018.1 dihydrofolate reductase [Aureimonas endophytica]
MPRLVAVVAAARNGVIGREGAMPWRLATDLKRYRQLTLGKPMIMGRKTLDSIGRVLDGRDTIVLTGRAELAFAGAYHAATPDEALEKARECAATRGADEIVIAGGGEIYRLFFDRLDRIYLTVVEAEPQGDAFFPAVDPACWRLVCEEKVPAGEKDSAATRFTVWDRAAPPES